MKLFYSLRFLRFTAFMVFVFSGNIYAQTNTFPSTGSAGVGTTTPDASALLEIKSTNKGLLIPRMTQAKRDAIISPALGLLIYQNNNNPGFYYFDGTSWLPITAKGANRTLSNLNNSTAINANLLPDTSGFYDLGSSALNWRKGYFSDSLQAGKDAIINGITVGKGKGSRYFNTAFGFGALQRNAEYTGLLSGGDYNTAIGSTALTYNNTGFGNTATGNESLSSNDSGSYNTATGGEALRSNTNGWENSGFGVSALFSNTLGSGNTASGSSALRSNTTGSRNTAMGQYAGLYNTTGSDNIAIGEFAGYGNTIGSFNTFIGDSSNSLSPFLVNATAIGTKAAVGASNSLVLGSISGINGATSSVNVGIGLTEPEAPLHIKGYGNTSSSSSMILQNSSSSILMYVRNDGNVGIGTSSSSARLHIQHNSSITSPELLLYENDNDYSRLSFQNNTGTNFWTIAAANNATNSSERFNIYNSRSGDLMSITGNGNVGIGTVDPAYQLELSQNSAAKPLSSTWTISSDQRLKKNVSDFKDGLDVIKKMHPVWFEYNGIAGLPTGIKSVGVIAQEVQKIAPYMIGKYKHMDSAGSSNEYLNYDANALFYLLVNSVKQLSAKNDSLQNQVSLQQQVNTDLQKQINELKTLVLQSQSTSSQNSAQIVELGMSAKLEQNVPNPFNNATTINYYLPVNKGNAYINFYSANGTLLKQEKLTANGQGSVHLKANNLPSGTYQYSLIIDGKIVNTKQMVQSK